MIEAIKTQAEYEKALHEVESLIDLDPEVDTKEGDRLGTLTALIVKYEEDLLDPAIKNDLICPNSECRETDFNVVKLARYRIPTNFNSPPIQTSKNAKYLLVCANCGYEIRQVEDLTPEEKPTLYIHITGDSEGYKRKALKEAGLAEDISFNTILKVEGGDNAHLFVTHSYWEKHQQEILAKDAFDYEINIIKHKIGKEE